MSKFIINPSIPSNYITTTFKKPDQNKPAESVINDFNNDTTRNITQIRKNRVVDRYTNVPKNNDRRNVRKGLDTKAIRQDRYDYTRGYFDPTYPEQSNYPLCPQKISTVFQNGGLHWTNNTTNLTSSYPLGHAFSKVTDAIRLSTTDCGCYFLNFSGEYELDWSVDGPQLISSSNNNITFATFDFKVSEQYFEIFLYPKEFLDLNTYVHIRYRIPVRYRYAYGDWTFWESLVLDGSISETEFVRVVNCCVVGEQNFPPPQPTNEPPLPTSAPLSCDNLVVPPTTIMGDVEVTEELDGDISTYTAELTSCDNIITPSGARWLGINDEFSYTLNFSSPINNLGFVLTATGFNVNENFIVTTNGGVPAISDVNSCFTTINNNEILSGAGSPSGIAGVNGGGGGIFFVTAPSSFTSLNISGSGGIGGSLFALCDPTISGDD